MIRRHRLMQALAALTLFVAVGCNSASSMLAVPDPNTTVDSTATGPSNAPAAATELRMAAPDVITDTALVHAIGIVAIVDGRSGGRIENEHVRLDIPAGAFQATATITVTFPDPARFVVDVDIQPEILNRFAKPVEMRLKCGGKALSAAAPAAWWWNPSDSLWYGLTGSRYEIAGDEVSVQLRHFSRYAAGGKAGW